MEEAGSLNWYLIKQVTVVMSDSSPAIAREGPMPCLPDDGGRLEERWRQQHADVSDERGV